MPPLCRLVFSLFLVPGLYFLAAAALSCSSAPSARVVGIEKSTLENSLSRLASEYGGIIGICAKDLATGETISVNGDSLFATASVIKVPILVELFYELKEGKLQRDQQITLSDSNKWGGSGVLQFFHGSSTQKLIDAAAMMIIVSDNTGTNMVLDAFANDHEAKLSAVNNRMKSLGLRNTVLQNKVMSFATKKKTPQSYRYGLGYSTPNDMVLLFEKMAKGELVDSASCGEMIAMLKNNSDAIMAVRYLPFDSLREHESLSIAHKTGWVSEVKADVGIVFGPKTNYAYAIFTDLSADRTESIDNKAVLSVARASRMLYDHFER